LAETQLDDLRFGVQYADVCKATDVGPPWDDGRRKRKGPVISQGSGQGGEREWQQDLWIWPLPPTGPLTFAIEWRAQQIPLTTHEVDADVIREAAERAQALFS
jgi:hypothetical protein